MDDDAQSKEILRLLSHSLDTLESLRSLEIQQTKIQLHRHDPSNNTNAARFPSVDMIVHPRRAA